MFKGNYSFLITGGCGFIGGNLIEYVCRNSPKSKVRVLDNLSVCSKDNVSNILNEIEFVHGDVRDPEVCLRVCQDIDVVVHLAACPGVIQSVENPTQDFSTNAFGTFNMLEAARKSGVKKFIFSSSGASLGNNEPPLNETKLPRPCSPYGAGKLSGEAYCQAYAQTFNLETTIFRFSNVYGPGSLHKKSVVAEFIKRALQQRPLVINGDGNQTRDFIYINDLLEAIALAVNSSLKGELFQIATGVETSVNELASMLKSIVENQTDFKVEILHKESPYFEVKKNYADIAKAKRLMRFCPKTSVENGLKQTLQYFLANKEV